VNGIHPYAWMALRGSPELAFFSEAVDPAAILRLCYVLIYQGGGARMKRGLFTALAIVAAVTFCMGTAFGADIELAKKSHIQKILERGELRVGFESGYMPF
jgi:hypothetical protein